jgi:uncharacterized cupin superfamily protein
MIAFPNALPLPTDRCQIAPDDVIDVEPLQFAHVATNYAGLSSGAWSSGPGRFNWTYWVDEVIYILDGSAMIRDCADSFHIWNFVAAGDVVHFSAGARAEWKVSSSVRKFWVMRKPSLFRRLLAKVRP